MRLEHSTHRLLEGTTSNAYVAKEHDFAPSGSSDAPGMLTGVSPTLGSSEFSFVKSLRMTALATAVAVTVTFTHDQTIARALVREGLPVPGETRSLEGFAPGVEDGVGSSARALRALLAALDDEPVEDGVIHPVEGRLSAFLQAQGSSGLHAGIFGAGNTARIAGVLRLLGRLRGVEENMRAQLLRAGLAAPSVEVRDAALQAAEGWEDTALAPIVRLHRESIPWLADYASRVAHELEG
jgi:hypothetical protein